MAIVALATLISSGVKERVRITDVSPRDGLQNEAGIIPTADKVRLIELLCATGVDEIEVTSFVSPKWVPQLGDAGEVMRGVAGLRPPFLPGRGWGKIPVDSLTPPARNSVTVERAKALRKAATGPERALWGLLSGKQLKGYKFRRQHPFGPYILDFYCPELRLAVELDGRSHGTTEAKGHDRARTEYLGTFGVEVVRYSDDHAVRDTAHVASDILRRLRARRTFPQPLPGRKGGRNNPLLSALVPNERGLTAAMDANRDSQSHLLSKLSVFTAASETFSLKNTNATIAETIERFRPVVAEAHSEDLDVRAYVSCVIACPFEGRISPAKVLDVVDQLMELDVDEIDLGDTIGAGTPESVADLLHEYERRHPIVDAGVPVTIHLHDTFGHAPDCVRTALDMGVRSFDGSVAGLGGCPYASKKLPDGTIQRAPGNISTELLVQTIEDAGYETGVDKEALGKAAAFAREIVARSRGM